jgi:hypothetical protein
MRMTVHYDLLVLAEQIVWVGHVERSRSCVRDGVLTVPAIGAPGAKDTTFTAKR